MLVTRKKFSKLKVHTNNAASNQSNLNVHSTTTTFSVVPTARKIFKNSKSPTRMGNPKVQSSDSGPTTLLTTMSTHDLIGNPSIQWHITPNLITKSSQVLTDPPASLIDLDILGKQIHTMTRHLRAQQSTEVLELTSNNVHSVSQGPIPNKGTIYHSPSKGNIKKISTHQTHMEPNGHYGLYPLDSRMEVDPHKISFLKHILIDQTKPIFTSQPQSTKQQTYSLSPQHGSTDNPLSPTLLQKNHQEQTHPTNTHPHP